MNGDTSDVVGGNTNGGVVKALLDEAAAKPPAATPAMPRRAPRRESVLIVWVSESLIIRLQDWLQEPKGRIFCIKIAFLTILFMYMDNWLMDHVLALRAFLRISETGAFGRAADQLNLPRSTVSKLLQDLENHLGVRLVQRTTRS